MSQANLDLTSRSSCPKCGNRAGAGAVACARCGLVFDRWSAATGTAMTPLDPKSEQLWDQVRAAWTDETRHDAFLKYCSVAGLLAPAGRRYREQLDERPGDLVATRMQERILSMATASFIRPTAPPRPLSRNRWFWTVLLVCAVGGIIAGLVFGR